VCARAKRKKETKRVGWRGGVGMLG